MQKHVPHNGIEGSKAKVQCQIVENRREREIVLKRDVGRDSTFSLDIETKMEKTNQIVQQSVKLN